MRKDMSQTCGFHYREYWVKANCDGTMSQEEWMDWFDNHCAKCFWMSEICMYGDDTRYAADHEFEPGRVFTDMFELNP